jgi:hypothetical protein
MTKVRLADFGDRTQDCDVSFTRALIDNTGNNRFVESGYA